MNEFEFITSLLAPLALAEKGAFGLKDDAALLDVPTGQSLVVTKDALVQGVHFIGDEPASLTARKALRVNLSDLAAMGATPKAYFLALMLPASTDEKWLAEFAFGLAADQAEFGITLMGGDTTRTSGPLGISITAMGLVPQGQPLLRSGAKVGDNIYVTGTIGDAALGLAEARENKSGFLVDRYRLPQPRLEVGQGLRGIATSCIDISDGLAQDLGHICTASGLGAKLLWSDIPLSDPAKAAPQTANAYEIILSGGDDYELLFTAPVQMEPAILKLAAQTGIAITRIGEMTEGKQFAILDGQGNQVALNRKGYQHF